MFKYILFFIISSSFVFGSGFDNINLVNVFWTIVIVLGLIYVLEKDHSENKKDDSQ